MLSGIKKFFEQHIVADLVSPDQGQQQHGLHVATTALLLEMSNQDDAIDADELAVLKQVLRTTFAVDERELDEMVALAQAELDEAIDYYQFTSLINEKFDYPQKLKVIECLWLVAYADDKLHHYEEHLVRRISELLHIRHSDFVSIKHGVSENK